MQCVRSTKPLFISSTSTLWAIIIDNDSTSNSSSSEYSPASPAYSEELEETDLCVWRRSELATWEYVIYAFVLPTLSFFGLLTNFINYIVFMRPKMTPSAFSYLAVLSLLDCISCLLITLTSLSRSFLYESTFWMSYDFQWQTPLFGFTTGAANLILACVSLDRFIYLHWGIPNGTPKFCRPIVARRMIIAVILLSILINVPYFWVFVVNDDGTFQTTEFYFSKIYRILNWFTFILLTVLPAIFLMMGNTAIVVAFCKWTKQSGKCRSTSSSNYNNKNTENRYKHQMKLTVTIVIVITLYLVGELPANLTSRKSVVNLLYGGDVTKVNFKSMQHLEVICITLNVVQLSMNIIVYAVINPCFVTEFCDCLKEVSDVWLRFTLFMGVAGCWRKIRHIIYGRSKHKNSECINNDNYRQHEEIVSDAYCHDSGTDACRLEATSSRKTISFICIRNQKQSIDNLSFNLERN